MLNNLCFGNYYVPSNSIVTLLMVNLSPLDLNHRTILKAKLILLNDI